MTTSSLALRADGRFGWKDYRSWDDGQRWELIGGEAFAMSPAPGTRHQRLVGVLHSELSRYFEGKTCEVFLSPTDVKLSDEDIVQPDLLVVCERDKVKPTHIEGAPTLVIEVLSPSSALFDRTRKMRLYSEAGVREVWLATPYPWLLEVFLLDGDSYRLKGSYSKDDAFGSPTFPELSVDLGKVFDFPIEPGEEIAMVKEGHPPYAAGSRSATAS